MKTVEVLKTDVRDLKMFSVFIKKEEDEDFEKGGVGNQAGMTRWFYQRVNFSDKILAGKLTKIVGAK